MPPAELDLARVIPSWQPAEWATFLVYVGLTLVWPGRWIRRLLGWTSGVRAERIALTLLCGVVACSSVYWLLLIAGVGRRTNSIGVVHVAIMAAPACAQVLDDWRRRGRRMDAARLRRRIAPAEALGYALVLGWAAYYVARTAPLFDYDGERLRLHGAAHSDKLTSVMPCAGLRYDVPPDNLRFAGYQFLNHYFPHLATAALERACGISYLNGYWFHLSALGVVVNGLAVLAFSRRVLKSYGLGCVAVGLYGLWQATPFMKPLDITPALALTALACCDRFLKSRRMRWAVASVLLIGLMPAYEVFHAATLVAALGLWGAWGLTTDLVRRRPLRRERLALPAAAAVAAWTTLQLLNLGESSVRPQVVVNNTFGDSYRHAWLDRAKDDDALGRSLAALYAWNRNRSAPSVDGAAADARPAWYLRVVGRGAFGLGLIAYVYARFGLWATFGVWHVVRRRSRGLLPSEAIIAAAACVGFGAPWIVDVGLYGGGQWWSSPNLYRVTDFAAWLTATLGVGVVVNAAATAYRPRSWPALVVAAFAFLSLIEEHGPAGTYFDVPREQVETLAFLREQMPHDEVLVHPWSDCSIRNAADGREAYLQKRFYMLASELAGRRCYCEGRADYLYWNGRIPHEEIERRLRLRRAFYEGPHEAEVDAVVNAGGVRWVVADVTHPPPQSIARDWPIVFRSGDVRVFRRPVIADANR